MKLEKTVCCAIAGALLTGCVQMEKSVALKPFPEFSKPRALTSGPYDHFFANYFGILRVRVFDS